MGTGLPSPTEPPPLAPGAIPNPAASPLPVPAAATNSPFGFSDKAVAVAAGSPLKPLLDESLRNLGFVSEKPNPFTTEMESTVPNSFEELVKRSLTAPPLPEARDVSLDYGQTGVGGRLDLNLARAGEIFANTLAETPIGQAALALVHGMGEPLVPAARRVGQMREGVNYEYVPGYDIFKDNRIADAGLSAQMHLFYGSMSPNQTKWIIERIQDKARAADHFERMGAGRAGALGANVVQFGAGVLGDPLTYTPATLGVKGVGLANKALRGALGGSEISLLASPGRMVLGTIGDGIKYAGVTGALAVAQGAIRNGIDPTESIDEVMDSLYVPMALAGSSAMLISAFARRTARSLVQRASDPDFLKGTPPSGARYVPDDLMGPVIHPTDEAAAGLVSRYDDAATQARRMERTAPGDRFDLRPSQEGIKAVGEPPVYAPGGDRAPGPRDKMPFNGVPDEHGNLPPGALATNYADVRKAEFVANPANAPYLREHPEFTTFQAGNVVVGPDGAPVTVYHGTNVAFDQFENAKAGTATAGDLPRVAEAARQGHWFVNRPDTASLYAETMAQRHGGSAQVRPAYISLKNPKILEDTEQVWASPEGLSGHVLKDVDGDEWRSTGKTWKMVKGGHELESIPVLRTKGSYASEEIAKAKAEGHDGVIIRNSLALDAKGAPAGMQELYVVFDSKSVKGFHERYDVREPKPAAAGATRVAHTDIQPGVFEPGKQEALIITPDGKIHRIDRIGPSPAEKAQAMEEGRPGDHAAFFAHHPDLATSTVVLTRFEDQIAAGIPRNGRTPQQIATLQGLESRWKRAGKADQAYLGLEPEAAAAEPIPVIINTIDERGRDRVHDRSGTVLNAKDLPEGQRLVDPIGNVLVVRNGTFYPEKIEQTPMASAATGGRGWLPTAEEKAAAAKPQRLVDMEFKPGELERAELGTTSKDIEGTPGLVATPPRDLAAGVHQKGTQQAYVVMPDGRIFEISREFNLTPEEIDDLAGRDPSYDAHAKFFARFPELPNHVIRLTRFEDSIAADLPQAGRTPQQTATLRRLKNSWEREGLGDKVHIGLDAPGAEKPAVQRVADEIAASDKPTNEQLGVGEPAAVPPALPADTRFGREPVGYNADGEAIYQRKDGSRTIMLEGNRPIEEPINDFGQERGQPFGGPERGERFKLAGEAAPGEGSVGAALSPQSLIYQREVLLAQGRMAPTGIGMERWPLTPLHRIFIGESVEAMRAAGDLVATGGSITMGNKQGIGSAVPIETLIQSNWEHMALTAVRGMKDDWAESRHAAAAAAGANAGTPVDFSGRSDIARLGKEVGDAIKRKFSRGEAGLSYNQFLQRVTEGLRNGDADRVADGSTPFVERAIARHRSVYETTKARMIEAGVFDEAYEAAKFDAYAGVRAVQKDMKEISDRANIERWPADRQRRAEEALMARLEDAEFQAKQAEDQLEKLRQHGPQLNGTAPSYAPRLWDAGALKRGEEHFIADIAVPWLMKEGGINDTMEATRIAKEMHTLLSKQNPTFERADVKNLFHSVAAPGSAMARTFTIPDELVKEFLIDDAELLLRYHVKQNAVAVEMKRRFGSMDMAEQIAAVEQEYRGQIIAANAGSDVPTEEAVRLVKLMKSDIADLQALRDKLYGTYGAAADPHAWDSRLIRMAKQFANITLLGGSGVSSLGDFVRPLMTEGLEAMYGYGLRSLMSDMRGTILKLGKEDMQLAGVGSDLMNNVRALQAADTGDVFGSRGRLEHGLNQANQWMFVLNGLNQITEWSKNWANIIIQGKMNKAIMQWGTVGAQELPEVPTGMVRVWHGGKLNPNDLGAVPVHGDFEIAARTGHGDSHLWYADVPEDSPWLTRQVTRDVQDSTAPAGMGFTLVGAPGEGQISAFMVTRLASLGIDEAMARRIALQLKVHGKDFDDLKLANIGKWENDDLALETYKAALNQSVNRTVVTPGVADRPNILSTELGSLIGQYKSWAFANMTRSLQSGLQENGSRFWYGAAAAVGFAIVLNELKSRLMYDRSTFDRPATAVIADGIDRSSILGWFSDANRAVETLSGNRLGVKALTGAPATAIDPARAIGAVAGPAASQAWRAGSVVNDFIGGHPTAKTFANLRMVGPGNTLPYLDPVYDHLISDGNFRRGMERSAQQQGKPAP